MALELLITNLTQQQMQRHSQTVSSSQSTDNGDQIYRMLQQQERENETNNLLEIAESIKEGCDIALNILNQLLTFEKLSAGMLQLENKTVTINQLLESNMKLFKMQAQQCGITFKLDRSNVDMNELRVYVDEHKMNQVIRNLLSNAMKFTPRGGVVEVKLQWVPSQEREGVVSRLSTIPAKTSACESIESSDSLRVKGKKFRKSFQQLTGFVPPTKHAASVGPVKNNEKSITFRSNVPLHHQMNGLVECGSVLISIVDSGPGVSAVSTFCIVYLLYGKTHGNSLG